jgi:hypothetical protein
VQQNVLSWTDYKNWVSNLAKGKMSYYCRGHANETWQLQTSFHREAAKYGTTLSQYLDTILPEVHYHISAVRDEIIDLRKEEEFGAFLALIQHHGFPTPLLDWTLSPYVAAYFAFREVNDQFPGSDNVKIYIFDYIEWTKSFQQPLNIRDMNVQYVSVLRPYARFNKRIIAQQGAFTVTNVSDMEAYLMSRSADVNKTFLYTAFISVKEKPHIMRELTLMGINEMTLFPSVGGICRALRSQFFSSDTVGPTFRELMEVINNTKPETSITPAEILRKET